MVKQGSLFPGLTLAKKLLVICIASVASYEVQYFVGF